MSSLGIHLQCISDIWWYVLKTWSLILFPSNKCVRVSVFDIKGTCKTNKRIYATFLFNLQEKIEPLTSKPRPTKATVGESWHKE